MVTKNYTFVLLSTNRYHIAGRDTRVRAMLLLTRIWDPQLSNPRGTVLKQADQNRTGPYWAEMWTTSGNLYGALMKQKPYGPYMGCSYGAHIFAQMGAMFLCYDSSQIRCLS